MRKRSIVCGALFSSLLMAVSVGALPAYAQLKHYDSDTPSFWQHPPPDWFLGDETEAQKGLAPPSGPATPTDAAELEQDSRRSSCRRASRSNSGRPASRSASNGVGRRRHAVRRLVRRDERLRRQGQGRQAQVKTIIKGLNMPTGVAFENGSLYVVAIDKLLRYDDAERISTRCRSPSSSMTTCRPRRRTDGNISPTDKEGRSTSASARPSTSASRRPACPRSAG